MHKYTRHWFLLLLIDSWRLQIELNKLFHQKHQQLRTDSKSPHTVQPVGRASTVAFTLQSCNRALRSHDGRSNMQASAGRNNLNYWDSMRYSIPGCFLSFPTPKPYAMTMIWSISVCSVHYIRVDPWTVPDPRHRGSAGSGAFLPTIADHNPKHWTNIPGM